MDSPTMTTQLNHTTILGWIIFTISLISTQGRAQSVRVEDLRSKYSLKREMCITIVNTTQSDISYSISLDKTDANNRWFELRSDVFNYSDDALTRKSTGFRLAGYGSQHQCFFPGRYLRAEKNAHYRLKISVLKEGSQEYETIRLAPFVMSSE
jgi:hypothetical protein